MPGCAVWSRRFFTTLLLLVMIGGGIVGWRERSSLLAWFYIRNLARASEATRQRWVGRVANLGEVALPGLFDCLTQSDEEVCTNARAALQQLAQFWGNSDARTADLALRLSREFARFSTEGQIQILDLAADWLRELAQQPENLISACGYLLNEAASINNEQLRTHALELCALLLQQPSSEQTPLSGEALEPARKLVAAALHAETLANRLRAIQLSLTRGMEDQLELVANLLSDDAAEVRRAALLAVSRAREAVHDDQLLPCLHDADPQVRRLCEQALIARGLRREYLEMGRLLTDPQPAVRLQVLDYLRQSNELDSGLWLRRLSLDASPAVRVAAVRAMTQQSFADLSDRIDQIAREDGNPTVRQLAQYYLACPRRSTESIYHDRAPAARASERAAPAR